MNMKWYLRRWRMHGFSAFLSDLKSWALPRLRALRIWLHDPSGYRAFNRVLREQIALTAPTRHMSVEEWERRFGHNYHREAR